MTLGTHQIVFSRRFQTVVQWLRARFNETFEKATFAGGKFGEQLSETAQDLEKLIYDKALEVVSIEELTAAILMMVVRMLTKPRPSLSSTRQRLQRLTNSRIIVTELVGIQTTVC